MASFLVLNGPNLNLLGQREPEVYGTITLADIEEQLTQSANEQGHKLTFIQSNAEHILVEAIHAAYNQCDFILINPAAFTHTSVALRDALLGVNIPFIEIHLSNIHTREAFRQVSYFSDKAKAVICGCGAKGYNYALDYAMAHCRNNASGDSD
ncbi:type II 3-dehydroquinate dehydratase [Marinomonas agarivorans]|nr:type II 3-dehydroquinate dehydratase [Marinomonas agarivorans]